MSTTKRQVFYSFHYKPDAWRTAQVRNIGAIEGNRPAPDNDWETIAKSGDAAIEKWIKDQMKYRSCTIVLVGQDTAKRKWIDYEIKESWKAGMGVVGLYIHGLKNADGYSANKGANPFEHLSLEKVRFSNIVKCYDPSGDNSNSKYDWISKNISAAAEEAVIIRKKY